ncbi:9786_t:CDS:2 [Funneliformis geosporum]|nr:9786_t:CDS:2 [Funneliformis geosporum]
MKTAKLNKHNHVEDINNRDSILTNVTEDLEGELEESLRVPEENKIHEQHNEFLNHSDITFEAIHRDSALTYATEKSENELTAELVKKEDSKEQNINNILQTFSEQTGVSCLDDIKRQSTITLYFYSISFQLNLTLIIYQERMQLRIPKKIQILILIMKHYKMIDNYKSKLDIPLRPEQFVRQESDVEILNRDPVK